MDWLILASRLVNLLTFGSPYELFCTRAYRNKWHRIVRMIDAEFTRRGHAPQHCAACYRWDRRFNGRPK